MAQSKNTQANKIWNHKQIHRFAEAKDRFQQHKINNLIGFDHKVPGKLFQSRNDWQILQIETKDHPYKAYASTIKNGSYIKHMQHYMLHHTNFDSNKMAKALWKSSQKDHIQQNVSQKLQHGMNHLSPGLKGINKPVSSKLHRSFKGNNLKATKTTKHNVNRRQVIRSKRNHSIQR